MCPTETTFSSTHNQCLGPFQLCGFIPGQLYGCNVYTSGTLGSFWFANSTALSTFDAGLPIAGGVTAMPLTLNGTLTTTSYYPGYVLLPEMSTNQSFGPSYPSFIDHTHIASMLTVRPQIEQNDQFFANSFIYNSSIRFAISAVVRPTAVLSGNNTTVRLTLQELTNTSLFNSSMYTPAVITCPSGTSFSVVLGQCSDIVSSAFVVNTRSSYAGCFSSTTTSPALRQILSIQSSLMTVVYCAQIATSLGYTYAALTSGIMCYGDTTAPTNEALANTICETGTPCSGNSSTKCGAFQAAAVYTVSGLQQYSQTSSSRHLNALQTPVSSSVTPASSSATHISSSQTQASSSATPVSSSLTPISSSLTPGFASLTQASSSSSSSIALVSSSHTPASSSLTPVSSSLTPAVSTSLTPASSSLTPYSSSAQAVISCSVIPAGNTATCYAHRATCHYSLVANQCTSPAPQSCGEFLSDSVGCIGNSTCVFIFPASLCVTKPPTCSSISGSTACSLRSDCRWIAGLCYNNTTTCSALTNQIQCAVSSCFWDIYLSSCFNTLAEISSNNLCSTWTSLSSTACVYHGCMMDPSNTHCVSAYTTGGTSNSVSLSSSVRYSNPHMIAGTSKFQVTASYSLALSNAPPVWTFITIGYSATSNLYNNPIPAPSVCNNVASSTSAFGTAPTTPAAVVPGLNMTLEQHVFNTWVSTKANLNFSSVPKTDPNHAAIYNLTRLTGFINVDPSGTSSIVTSVALNTATASLDLTITADLTTIIAQCAPLGAFQTQTLAGTYYTLPLVAYQHTGQASPAFPLVSSTPLLFSVYVPSSGSVSVSAESGYTTNLYLIKVDQSTANCPAGQAIMLLTYELIVGNVFSASSYYVGPMTDADILFSSAQAPGVLFNCYGDYVYSFTNGTSVPSLAISKSTFVISTLCRVLQTTSDTFSNCSYANYADRVQAMGGNYPFPAIDTQHTFFVTLRQAPLVLATMTASIDSSTWTQTSSSSTPVQFPVSINVKSSIASPISAQLQVYGGLLPYPSDTLLSDVTIVSYINSSGTISTLSSIPNYTSTTSSSGAFTFVIGMASPQLQALSTLLISADTSFAFTALDKNGLSLGVSFYWNTLFQLMTYVPKQAVNLGLCSASTCKTLPATSSNIGFDGFSIPVAKLIQMAPTAAGFAFTANYAFTLAGQMSQNSLHSMGFSLSSRRSGSNHNRQKSLQQTFEASPTSIYTGVIGASIRMTIDTQTETPAPSSSSSPPTALTSPLVLLISGVSLVVAIVGIVNSVCVYRARSQTTQAKRHSAIKYEDVDGESAEMNLKDDKNLETSTKSHRCSHN